MAKHHMIFRKNVLGEWTLDCTIPLIPDDPNHGLPQRFFDIEAQQMGIANPDAPKLGDGIINFEIDIEADTLQWWPAIGPAPHWNAKLSDFMETKADIKNGFAFVGKIMEAFEAWFLETY